MAAGDEATTSTDAVNGSQLWHWTQDTSNIYSNYSLYNDIASLTQGSGAVKYFEGTPIPTSVLPLGLLMLAFYKGWFFPVYLLGGIRLHLAAGLFILSGSLMISKTIRVPKP